MPASTHSTSIGLASTTSSSPSSAARAFAASTIFRAPSVEMSFPPGRRRSAAWKPVSPGPAASSMTVWPGCGSIAAMSQSLTGCAARWKASRAFAQPAAPSSQRPRLAARKVSGSSIGVKPMARA